MPKSFPFSAVQIASSGSPVDSYIYSGFTGKSQADTASKEASVFLYELKSFLSLFMFPRLLKHLSSANPLG